MTAQPENMGIDGREVLASCALDTVSKATLPIYFTVRGGELQFDRSAVLFRFGSNYFLLSALHELAKFDRPDVRAYTRAGAGDTTPVDITGSKIVAMNDPVDVGVIRLDASVHRRMAAVNNAITSKNIDFDPTWDATTPFVICGYPKVLEGRRDVPSGPLKVPRAHTLLTSAYVGALANPDHFSRDVHLSVAWPKEFEPIEVDGKLVEPPASAITSPRPHGISGGGLWRLGLQAESDEPRNYICKLTAIQHTVNRDMGYAIGTRSALALYLIWKSFPELQPLIEKELPNQFPTHVPLS